MDSLRDIYARYLRNGGHSFAPPQAVLFDMDGVLFDSMPYHAKAWTKAMRKYGLRFGEPDAYMNEGRTAEGTINLFFCEQLGREATADEVREIYGYKTQVVNTYRTPPRIRGALSLVREVRHRGLQRVLVTGSAQETLWGRLQKYYPGLFTLDKLVTANDVKIGKPSPEPYLMGLQKAGLPAHRAMVVENAPLGVRAAVAAGIFCVAVNTGPLPDRVLLDEGASAVYPHMTALHRQFDGLFGPE